MRRKSRGPLLLGMCVLLSLSASASGEPAIRIDEIQVGFGGYYRPGHVVPITVKMANTQGVAFEGELRALQNDEDGDRIVWRTPAPVGPEAAVYWTVLINPSPSAISDGRVQIAVVDSKDRTVASYNLRDPRVLLGSVLPVPPGSRVVGVITPGDRASLGPLSVLTSPPPTSNSLPPVATVGPVQVVYATWPRMPVKWQGLDMIDVLYWDDPSPRDLTVDQQAALAQWVRRGGQLVVGLGTRAQEFASELATGNASELASLLPVTVIRTGEQASLSPLGAGLLGDKYETEKKLSTSALVTLVQAKRGALVLARGGGPDNPLLCRWSFGAGSVTAMSTSLKDSGATSARWSPRLLAALVGLQTLDKPLSNQRQTMLTDGINAQLDSAEVGGLLVGLVVLMSLAYAALAGPGTWVYLRYRNKRHLSWWVFGAVVLAAILGSMLLSLFNVRGPSVSQVSVMDVEPNSRFGVVRGYFGLYEPSHRVVALELDDTDGLLIPMIDAHSEASGQYPDVRTYDLDSNTPSRLQVPIRRTIKRFQLNWRGDVGGVLSGTVTLRDKQVVAGAINNQFPAELKDPILVYYDTDPALASKPRRVLSLKTLPPGTTSFASDPAQAPEPIEAFHERLTTLMGIDASPISGVGRTNRFDRLAPLLSTLESYRPPPPKNPDDVTDMPPQLARAVMGRVDRSEMIVPGKAMLIATMDGYMPGGIRFDRSHVSVTGPMVIRCLLDVTESRTPPASRPAAAPAKKN